MDEHNSHAVIHDVRPILIQPREHSDLDCKKAVSCDSKEVLADQIKQENVEVSHHKGNACPSGISSLHLLEEVNGEKLTGVKIEGVLLMI